MVTVKLVGEDEARIRRLALITGMSVDRVVRDAVSRSADIREGGPPLTVALAEYIGAPEGASPGSSGASDAEIAEMIASEQGADAH
jgi:hypothetical protein